ncbi:hypothetical protein [Saccharopolyspora elongata]|uniref:WXG100 family type VII secretion target n=1 Tax=Saccharopolyspora elongata TaxID=2530387 RepID=A0A4R4YA44_9PSEU|nr:hypothetical protein [Saccharopolyspora elongata]TDD40674.1 hypothetical protein E1288_34965 [Saccharopolyspora elongata]
MTYDAAAKTGDPAVLGAQAQAWSTLAAALRSHEADLQSRLAHSQTGGGWTGPAADAFHNATDGLTGRIDALSTFCEEMAQALGHHAQQQKQISEILKEIAIQIAALVAYIAAAAFFPALIATAEAYIATLVAQSNRMLALLAQILATLTRWLASVRAAVQRLAAASWRGESFSFGYGRALVEGFRDFAIDIAASSTAAGITGKNINPEHLFTNAAISFGVGGVFGGVTASGLKRKLDSSGEILRAPDGRPDFVPFSGQIDAVVQSLRWNPSGRRQATTPPEPNSPVPRPHREQAIRRLDDARANARELGLRGNPREHRHLSGEADAAHERASDAREKLSAAQSALQRAEISGAEAHTALQAARSRVDHAEQRLWRAESLLAVYQRSGNQRWQDDAENFVREARTEHHAATQHVTAVREQHDRAVQALDKARDSTGVALREVEQTEDVVNELRRMLAASNEVRAAAIQFNMHGTFDDKLREVWRHNDWRDSFGTAKPWQSIVFHESVRDIAKGASGSAAQSAAGIANGSRDPGTTGRDVLIGALAGGVRGVAVGSAGNRAFPDMGLEEGLFRIGLKSTESFTREQINGPR